jgi:hypothetical protein
VGFYQRQRFIPQEEYVTVGQMKIHQIHLQLPTTASKREPVAVMVDTPQESSQTCGSHATAPSQDGELLERQQTEIQVHCFRYGERWKASKRDIKELHETFLWVAVMEEMNLKKFQLTPDTTSVHLKHRFPSEQGTLLD